jgi:hypothetical protein
MRLITETAGADGERVNAISREILRPVALVLLRSDTSYSLHRVKTTGDEEVYHLKNQKVAGGIFAYDGRFGRYRYIYDINKMFSPTADKKRCHRGNRMLRICRMPTP